VCGKEEKIIKTYKVISLLKEEVVKSPKKIKKSV